MHTQKLSENYLPVRPRESASGYGTALEGVNLDGATQCDKRRLGKQGNQGLS
jgi:hypothetical protein